MKKLTVYINTSYISVDKLLKLAGVVTSGGQAFQLVEQKLLALNGNFIKEKRKKYYLGDVVLVNNEVEIKIIAE